MLTIKEIKDFFLLENSHAKKELGQNFLIDETVAKQIVDSVEIKKEDNVLEIGPGLGALSGFIVGKSIKYSLVEYDQKFVNFLSENFKNYNVNIIKGNILKYKVFEANKIIGNLPYYITTDTILNTIVNYKNLDIAVFMMQKECYKRITAKFGSQDYNIINILISYLFDVNVILEVKKDKFFPVPKVDSIVVKFVYNGGNRDLVKPLYLVTRTLFLNKRKVISTNLNSIVKNKEKTNSIILSIGLKLNNRAEELTLQNYINLTNELLKEGIIKL
ncbi:MAG: 16S rRNA (adenine(1518)-N(6)/adenine(1519)-N(6))-dimethyltransferase RsmA [Bacilli bacterium]